MYVSALTNAPVTAIPPRTELRMASCHRVVSRQQLQPGCGETACLYKQQAVVEPEMIMGFAVADHCTLVLPI